MVANVANKTSNSVSGQTKVIKKESVHNRTLSFFIFHKTKLKFYIVWNVKVYALSDFQDRQLSFANIISYTDFCDFKGRKS